MTIEKSLTASDILTKGHWHGDTIDRVTLSYDDRFRRRIMLKGEKGTDILLNLKEARLLHSGDALKTQTGELIEVVAAPEKLIEITCDTPIHLLKTAWHLGNRHLAAEISENTIKIRYDKVILDMVLQLGASAAVIDAPFNPEGGAYAGGETPVHSHEHGHSHGHDHDHPHEHGHGHDHTH